ncbi:MAG: glycosyltransferase family 25 protein [Bacteroidales bacterium]|nr:glycosyltransferase family 25 protein [Bacteroidales bacterium]
MKQIPIFVVNLKKDTEKKEHMQALCKKYSLECQFIDTVYGKDLSEKKISEVYDKERALKEFGRELTPGEIGCALSHISIYKKMKNENIEKALILEDDIFFNNSIIDALQAINKFPKDWELIAFNYFKSTPFNKLFCLSFWYRDNTGKYFQSVRFTEVMHGTGAYVINHTGVSKLIDELDKNFYKPIDLYTNDEVHINVYGIFPQAVQGDQIFARDSNIAPERNNISNITNKISPNEEKHSIKLLLKRFILFQAVNKIKIKIYHKFYCLFQITDRLKKPKQYINANEDKQ